MSITSALNSAAAGLQVHANALNVVSDNISNLNSDAHKATRVAFSDIISGHGSSSTGSSGQGSRVVSAQQVFSQGTLITTGADTDFAMQGGGFFCLRGNLYGDGGPYYTRAGRFAIDKEGFLVNPQGLRVQGYQAKTDGSLMHVLGDLSISPNTLIPPYSTNAIDIAINLKATETIPAAFDAADPINTSNYSTSIGVIDSLGQNHAVDFFFRRSGTGTYDWYALVDGAEVTGGTAGTAEQIGTGSLTFNTNGALQTVTGNSVNADFLNATGSQVISIDFGSAIDDGGTGFTGTTSFASEFALIQFSQNGYPEGTLSSFQVNESGVLMGSFTNGSEKAIGQIAVAAFPNSQGLNRLGNGLYQPTSVSGNPAIGVPATGGRGSVAGGALELSNVDLASEFMNLMSFQRGFESNSRTVHIANQMLQELVNLAR